MSYFVCVYVCVHFIVFWDLCGSIKTAACLANEQELIGRFVCLSTRGGKRRRDGRTGAGAQTTNQKMRWGSHIHTHTHTLTRTHKCANIPHTYIHTYVYTVQSFLHVFVLFAQTHRDETPMCTNIYRHKQYIYRIYVCAALISSSGCLDWGRFTSTSTCIYIYL